MKSFFVAIIILIVLGVVGYSGFRYFSSRQTTQPTTQTPKSVNTTLTGVLKSATGETSFMIVSGGKTTRVASYSLQLDEYVGRNVKITGQYSGNTLYVDAITSETYAQ